MDEIDQDSVYALHVAPTAIYAARRSGLYRSADGGATWQALYDALNLAAPLMTTALALAGGVGAAAAIYAGVPGGVLRSEDGGAAWQFAAFATAPDVSSLAISPQFNADSTLFAGTLGDGVLRSDDRGRSWAAWNFGMIDHQVLALAISPDFARDSMLFAGSETGLCFSSNGGRSWDELDLPAEAAPVLSLALSPEFSVDGAIFVGSESGGLWRSNDRGRSWARLATATPDEPVNALALASPARIAVALPERLLISNDYGESWNNIAISPSNAELLTLALAGSDSVVVGCSDGRVSSYEL